jgi:hypothetical protein
MFIFILLFPIGEGPGRFLPWTGTAPPPKLDFGVVVVDEVLHLKLG